MSDTDNTTEYEDGAITKEAVKAHNESVDAVARMAAEAAESSVAYDRDFHTSADAALDDHERSAAAFDDAAGVETPTRADYFPETVEEPPTTLEEATERYNAHPDVAEPVAEAREAVDADPSGDSGDSGDADPGDSGEGNGEGTGGKYEGVLKDDLSEKARERGLHVSGTVDELVARLEAYDAYDAQNKDKLIELADGREIDSSGKKDEIIARLIEADAKE